ncbi:hypothetical protein BV22DRAFT_1032522 [Leucogyrophana mollusca]|uniref:Uncharacterized protein n=1 Tax=Leucogyrophana mollusca TaxID=85980 RepID=A0ACB8BN91_9AGAM|nr:hypothetical protein BV22DRAFT_1032522 [Leucogyrophana mollusca]
MPRDTAHSAFVPSTRGVEDLAFQSVLGPRLNVQLLCVSTVVIRVLNRCGHDSCFRTIAIYIFCYPLLCAPYHKLRDLTFSATDVTLAL